MLGGFLGAGKTTAVARLAGHYMSHGLQVGLVTNDQAYDLVDTRTFRALGFRVGEVPGACFCCKFDELVDTAAGFSGDEAPDVIIAEPVGSCTDLVATVIEPLRRLHAQQYEIGPLAVLLKPEHGRKILGGETSAGVSPKASYIFLKQLEEADAIVINKVDKLSEHEREQLVRQVGKKFPRKPVYAMSARHGDGFDQLVEYLDHPGLQRNEQIEVDYDIYAEGEAELGWLNCGVNLTSDDEPFALDQIIVELIEHLREGIIQSGLEAAHVKIFGQFSSDVAIANLVGSAESVELSRCSGASVPSAILTVNARVVADPAALELLVVEAVSTLAASHNLSSQIEKMQRFRPGRPVPTHRVTN